MKKTIMFCLFLAMPAFACNDAVIGDYYCEGNGGSFSLSISKQGSYYVHNADGMGDFILDGTPRTLPDTAEIKNVNYQGSCNGNNLSLNASIDHYWNDGEFDERIISTSDADFSNPEQIQYSVDVTFIDSEENKEQYKFITSCERL
jgi:hypothetical protein